MRIRLFDTTYTVPLVIVGINISDYVVLYSHHLSLTSQIGITANPSRYGPRISIGGFRKPISIYLQDRFPVFAS